MADHLITMGSVSREEAAKTFEFLEESIKGNLIKEFTHTAPDFVFWIYPDGRIHDARDAHRKNVPKGFGHILKDEPDYGGFLRGRLATKEGQQLIVVYCRSEALATDRKKIDHFLEGVSRFPVPVEKRALVVSDNGDLYGTLADLEARLA